MHGQPVAPVPVFLIEPCRAQAVMSGAGRKRRARSRSPLASRKERSLGVLCDKFLLEYGGLAVGDPIGLDEAGALLGVERRRLYDITNVLEAVEVLVRSHKSRRALLCFRLTISEGHLYCVEGSGGAGALTWTVYAAHPAECKTPERRRSA